MWCLFQNNKAHKKEKKKNEKQAHNKAAGPQVHTTCKNRTYWSDWYEETDNN